MRVEVRRIAAGFEEREEIVRKRMLVVVAATCGTGRCGRPNRWKAVSVGLGGRLCPERESLLERPLPRTWRRRRYEDTIVRIGGRVRELDFLGAVFVYRGRWQRARPREEDGEIARMQTRVPAGV